MAEQTMIICENCHAKILASEVQCPYCGAMNTIGSTRQYMEDLENIKDGIGRLDDIDRDAYVNEVRKNTKYIKRIMVIIGIIILMGIAIFSIFQYIDDRLWGGEQTKEEMLALREIRDFYYPKLTALYEDEKYEEMCELINQAYTEHDIFPVYEWEHYEFYCIYNNYCYCDTYLTELEEGAQDMYTQKECLLNVLYLIYRNTNEKFLNERDIACIEQCDKEVLERLEKTMQITESDLEELYLLCEPEGEGGNRYIPYDKADKAVGKYLKNR